MNVAASKGDERLSHCPKVTCARRVIGGPSPPKDLPAGDGVPSNGMGMFIRRRAACSSRAMGEPFVTFAYSYVHTIFCCFSVFVPFDTSLTVPRWLHNLQTKRRPEAGIYPAGSRKVQAGKPAPLPGGQRESRPVPVARGQGDKAAELLRQLLS